MQSFTEKFRKFSTSPGKVAKRILRRSNVFSSFGSVRRKQKHKCNVYNSFRISSRCHDNSFYHHDSGNDSKCSCDRKLNASYDVDTLNASFIPIERLLCKSKFKANGFSAQSAATMEFLDLSDSCILHILDNLNVYDICNFRLVNKRLNLLIQRHSALLPRKHHIQMTVFSNSRGLIDFERPLNKRLKDASIESCNLDRALRHIVVDRCLHVECIIFDTALCHAIQRSQGTCLYEANFNNCHLNISANELASFLAHTGLQKLSIENCSFVTETVISDEIFSYTHFLQSFAVSSNVIQMLPALTCNTLMRWAESERWPTLIALNNIQCSFSILSIVKMIKSYIRRCYSDSVATMKNAQSVLWNFGLVSVAAADAKASLKAIGSCVQLTNTKDYSLIALYVRCHDDAPPLFVRFHCVNVFANLI